MSFFKKKRKYYVCARIYDAKIGLDGMGDFYFSTDFAINKEINADIITEIKEAFIDLCMEKHKDLCIDTRCVFVLNLIEVQR